MKLILTRNQFKINILLFTLMLIGISSSMQANTYTVINTNDAGAGSLRQAITDANNNAGADLITFNIPGAGVKTIVLASILPTISGPTTMNAYTQPGSIQGGIGLRTILIAIDGGDITGSTGLFRFTPNSDGSNLSGFSIYNTGADMEAVAISPDCLNIHIWGNYIGVLPNGTSPAAAGFNGDDGILIGDNVSAVSGTFTNIFIGTDGNGINDANEGNVISNNADAVNGGDGIQVGSNIAAYTYTNIRISGNYIGVEADGITPAPNGISMLGVGQSQGQDGIYLRSASNILIGSDANGISDILERNIISGNNGHGIEMLGTSSNINIAGNHIGTDKTGLSAVPNGKKGTSAAPYCGIQITGTGGGNASNIIIGFNDAVHTTANAAATRNIISGNQQHGIQFFTVSGAGNKVSGNYIGVDATGNLGLGNGRVNILHGAVVSATGVDLTAANNILIGTDADGDDDILERNIISGNIDARGIYIRNASNSNIVAGNYIGVGANGNVAIGNEFSGVHIDGSNNNRIGSNDDAINDALESNTIANNAKSVNTNTTTSDGVRVTLNATGNRISRNIFYSNKENPIDLANNGVSVNDGITTGAQPNLLLDYPVFTDYSVSGNIMTISGYIGTCNGNETVVGTPINVTPTIIQVYKAANDGDQNGAITNSCSRFLAHGEGIQYLGSITVTNGLFTNATFTMEPGTSFIAGDKLTGITIDNVTGNTSEFGVEVSPMGYIYVQKKALDETSSVNFPFSVSGGATIVPNFNLNDNDAQIAVLDIGASENGRLWAIAGNTLYYRDMGASAWVATNVTTAKRVDGGTAGNCYYINTSNNIFFFDGTTSTSISSGISATDIGNAWDLKPYVVTSGGALFQYSGSGTTWAQIGATTNNKNVDGNPINGNAIIGKTDNTIASITNAGAATSLGNPAAIYGGTPIVRDVAVASDGSIFSSYDLPAAPYNGNTYAFKWQSGTTWSALESTSRLYVTEMTGGSGGQIWGAYSGTNDAVTRNIFTRTFDGTTSLWLNDERVRTANTGNSIMIAVAPGTYTLTELLPANWDLQHIYVYDPTNNSTINLVGNSATVAVSVGETVTALFENGMVNPFSMTNSCTTAYTENFGTGPINTYGPALAGQTSYHYQTTGNTLANNYKITGNANKLFSGAVSFTDHTSGDGLGRMMIVDANNEIDAFFRRRFTGIIPGATYNFSAWIANINNGEPIKPNVTFDVIDPATYAILASFNTGNIATAGWNNYGLVFTATTTTFDLLIRNNGQGGNGNDLAIDDISFALIPSDVPVTTVANSNCGSLGTITITSPVGASYQYTLDTSGTWQSSPVFSNLNAGQYTIYARFIGTNGCISSKADTIRASICGNVFNDNNGLTDSTVNGLGTNAGGVNAVLIDPITGNVLAVVPVNANGTYEFPNLLSGNYNIMITTISPTIGSPAPNVVLPANWVNTGENIGSGAGNDGLVNGIITNIVLDSISVANVNFGIEQPPIANNVTALSQVNPGGTNTVVVPNLSGTDPEDGVLGSGNIITITTLPTDGILYYNGIPVVVGQVIPNYNPSVLTVDPNSGAVTVIFTYTVTDSAGVVDATPAIVTMPFSTLEISGNIFDDGNGLADSTVNGIGTNAGSMNAVLIDPATGLVIAVTPIAVDGTYSFTGLDAGSYSVLITTSPVTIGNPVPAVVLPPNWVHTGDNIGSDPGNDGTPNGIITNIILMDTSVLNVNFGIEQLPNSDNVTQTIPSPSVNVIPAGTVSNPISGADPEDGVLGNPNNIIITTLPANATMYYNGVLVTVDYLIEGFNPLLISYTGITLGSNSIQFEYAFIDSAGIQDPTPATYTVNWAVPLPVYNLILSAIANTCSAELQWSVTQEVNFSHYEVERSTKGGGFVKIATVKTKEITGEKNYSYKDQQISKGDYTYKLKVVDIDNTFAYTNTESVSIHCNEDLLTVFPNPTTDRIHLNIKAQEASHYVIKIYNAVGKLLMTSDVELNENEYRQLTYSLNRFSDGLYYVHIINDGGKQIYKVLKH